MLSPKFLALALSLVSYSSFGVNAQTPAYLSPVALEPGLSSGKCLTAASNSDGAQVSIQSCTGADAQKWTFDGSGTAKVFGDKCLDVTNGSNNDGTKLQIWSCTSNNANQQFYYTGDYR